MGGSRSTAGTWIPWLERLTRTVQVFNLKQNEAQSARADSTHKGVNQRSKQTLQQKPESPTVTVTWQVVYKVHKLHQRYIFTHAR